MKKVADTTTFTSIWGHGKAIGGLYNSAINFLKEKISK